MLAIDLEDSQALLANGIGGISLTVRPEVDTDQIKVRFEARGGARLLEDGIQTFQGLKRGESLEAKIQMEMHANGRAEIQGWALGYNAQGEELFGAAQSLFLIKTAQRVLSGDSSFMALEIAELERQWREKEITQEEYERRRQELRRGGAKESIVITPPSQ